MNKKLLSLLTSVVMALGMMPVVVFAVDTLCVRRMMEGGAWEDIAPDGYGIIRITGAGDYVASGVSNGRVIEITADAGEVNLVLDSVDIDVSRMDFRAAINITGGCNTVVRLRGDNRLSSGFNCAGLQKSKEESNLTITSEAKDAGWEGSLVAQSGKYGAGIGGGAWKDGINITISGGDIAAIACEWGGAGIGGGRNGRGKGITIKGGTVHVKGGSSGAGIGGGAWGKGGDITISGGKVIAIGGEDAAGIGRGCKRKSLAFIESPSFAEMLGFEDVPAMPMKPSMLGMSMIEEMPGMPKFGGGDLIIDGGPMIAEGPRANSADVDLSGYNEPFTVLAGEDIHKTVAIRKEDGKRFVNNRCVKILPNKEGEIMGVPGNRMTRVFEDNIIWLRAENGKWFGIDNSNGYYKGGRFWVSTVENSSDGIMFLMELDNPSGLALCDKGGNYRTCDIKRRGGVSVFVQTDDEWSVDKIKSSIESDKLERKGEILGLNEIGLDPDGSGEKTFVELKMSNVALKIPVKKDKAASDPELEAPPQKKARTESSDDEPMD